MRNIFRAFIFSAVVFFTPTLVSAGTFVSSYVPIATGTYNQFTPKTGVVHFTQVDEVVCNGNTDRVHTATVGNRDSYQINISNIPSDATITKIEVKPCASRNSTGGGSATLDVFINVNGSNTSDVGSYALPTGTTPTNLATTTVIGSPLTIQRSAISTIETGVVYTAGTKGVRVSNLVTTITYSTPPNAPSGLTATATDLSHIALAWNDNSSDETSFWIERSTDGINYSLAGSVSANVTTYTASSLSASTTYYHRVFAQSAIGNSSSSNAVVATTYPSIPTAPSSLTASAASSTAVTLQWSDNSTGEAGYLVERSDNGITYINIATTTANVVSLTNQGLTASTTYYYQVRGYNISGNSAYSNTTTVTTLTATATYRFYSLPGDGWVDAYDDTDWESVRSGSSTSFELDYTNEGGLVRNYASSSAYEISRMFLPFNTSIIPTSARASSASLYVQGQGRVTSQETESYIGLVGPTTQSSTSSLSTGDYLECGALNSSPLLSQTITWGDSWSSSDYSEFILNEDGINAIVLGGVTKLGVRGGHDLENVQPSGDNSWYFVTQSIFDKRPYLDITVNQ